MEFHRQTEPKKLNWLNRLVFSFLLRQALKAQRKSDIAARRLTRYADQLGYWEEAIRWLHPVCMDPVKVFQKGSYKEANPKNTAAPKAPPTPFQNSDPTPSFFSAMPDTSGTEHSNLSVPPNPPPAAERRQ